MLERYRTSHQMCSVTKGAFRNFAKFTKKQLCKSLFFSKVAGLRPALFLKKRPWHGCFPANFGKFLAKPFLRNTSGGCSWRKKKFSHLIHYLSFKLRRNITLAENISIKKEIWNKVGYITYKDLKINGNSEIILKNVQKQTPEVLFKKSLRPATFLKKRLWHRCFPVNFAKFLRTPF